MVSAEHRVQICVCLALILCLRLAGCRFFERREILAKFFKAPVHLQDDTMKALLDMPLSADVSFHPSFLHTRKKRLKRRGAVNTSRISSFACQIGRAAKPERYLVFCISIYSFLFLVYFVFGKE